MNSTVSRRKLMGAGIAMPLLALPGCTTLGSLGGFGLEDAVRRLLTVASQRGLSNLVQENGFFQDEVARVSLPAQLAGAGGVAAALLRSPTVQNQLLRLVNNAAAQAAGNVAPLVYDSIRTLTITDALSIVRGGPTAATSYLERSIGERIVAALFPGVGNALRVLDSGILNQALGATTGINFAGLQQDVTRKAAQGIWRAIGREEATIRANPSATNDPLLMGVFGVLR
ncbi:MAG TPA: DUF4197 domain-containing protein [Allosphingosinicella sp.]|nr:DUF4197 domain-containing protein [Allosphingosinicella sp.]